MKLTIATSNLGKLAEFRELLPAIETLALPPGFRLPEETGATYEDNARLKAEAASAALAAPVLGDDSGLEVAALAGQPGLYSARFAKERLPGETQDQANRRVLLGALKETKVPPEEWQARFVCVLALARPGLPTLCFRGEARGRILWEERGVGGFGYDPLLLYPPLGLTFAEMSSGEKHAVSHRGRAVQAMWEEKAVRAYLAM